MLYTTYQKIYFDEKATNFLRCENSLINYIYKFFYETPDTEGGPEKLH